MEVKLKCSDIDVLRYSAGNVVTLREQFPNRSDDDLARYLVANNNDVVAAAVQLQKADALSGEYGNIKMSRCITEIAKGEAYIYGSDRDGRPLIVVNARLHDPVNRDVKESVLMTLWWTEQAIARLPDMHSRFTILLDRDNCEKAADTEYMQALAQVFLDLHPERLHRAIVYPSGIVFYSMWNLLLKWFMAENTREKVLPAVSLSDVLQHIDEQYVPASLGGKCTYKFDVNDFHDPDSLSGGIASEGGGGEGTAVNGASDCTDDVDAHNGHDRSAATTVESPFERADIRELVFDAADADPDPVHQRYAKQLSPQPPHSQGSGSFDQQPAQESGDVLVVLRGVLSLQEFEQTPSPREYGSDYDGGSDLADHFLDDYDLEEPGGQVGVGSEARSQERQQNVGKVAVTGSREVKGAVAMMEVPDAAHPIPSAEVIVAATTEAAEAVQDLVSGEDTEGEDVWKEVDSQDGAPPDDSPQAGPVAMFPFAGSQASPYSCVDRLIPEQGDDAVTPFAYDGTIGAESYHYNVNRSNMSAAASAVNRDIAADMDGDAGADAAAAEVNRTVRFSTYATVPLSAPAPAPVPVPGSVPVPVDAECQEWDGWREVSSDDGAEDAAAADADIAALMANAADAAGPGSQSAPALTATSVESIPPLVTTAPTSAKASADEARRTQYVQVALSAVWCGLVTVAVGIGLYSVYYPSSITFNISVTALAQLVLLVLLLCSFL